MALEQRPRLLDSDTGLPWWIAGLAALSICGAIIFLTHVIGLLVWIYWPM